MLLEGKKGLIYGVRNERSIAWGCVQSLAREGASLALSVMSEREEKDARKLAATLPTQAVQRIATCDMTNPEQMASLHEQLQSDWGSLDFVVHSVAFARGLTGRYVDTTLDDWVVSLNVSAYTLVAAAKAAEPLMTNGGALVTLTYIGGARVVPNYNSAGIAKAALESSVRYLASDLGPQNIRVNAISAGPTMTLSARGISGFGDMYKQHALVAPLRHSTTPDEVGDACVFLVSPWARGVTGDVLYVDSGYHVVGFVKGQPADS